MQPRPSVETVNPSVPSLRCSIVGVTCLSFRGATVDEPGPRAARRRWASGVARSPVWPFPAVAPNRGHVRIPLPGRLERAEALEIIGVEVDLGRRERSPRGSDVAGAGNRRHDLTFASTHASATWPAGQRWRAATCFDDLAVRPGSARGSRPGTGAGCGGDSRRRPASRVVMAPVRRPRPRGL